MEKKFYPDVVYNRKQRNKFLVLFVLAIFCLGGLALTLFLSENSTSKTLSFVVLFVLIMAIMVGFQTFANYPVKKLPLISVEGKTVIFGANDRVKVSDIVSVSVCIDVPRISKTNAENVEYLKKVAAEKPNEPVLGTCDVTVINEKGKEIVKYAIVDDCIGALEALLSIGVKKYRILYSMKKLSEDAKYKLGVIPVEETNDNLSENDKMMQLL